MPETPDWAEIREGQLNMAELVWTYHHALLAAGFEENYATYFSTVYQDTLLRLVLSQPVPVQE